MVIRSVLWLLITILFENLYFMIDAIARGFDWSIHVVLENPLIWSIPKIMLLSGVIFFIVASVSPSGQEHLKQIQKLPKVTKC
jgi:hypothetical protein